MHKTRKNERHSHLSITQNMNKNTQEFTNATRKCIKWHQNEKIKKKPSKMERRKPKVKKKKNIELLYCFGISRGGQRQCETWREAAEASGVMVATTI